MEIVAFKGDCVLSPEPNIGAGPVRLRLGVVKMKTGEEVREI